MTTLSYLTKLQKLLLWIPKGRVMTYKTMAQALGIKSFRQIGQLLHHNPEPDRYPCYKVVNSNGTIGGFSRGRADKIRRLKLDGIRVKKDKILNFEQITINYNDWHF